MKPNELKEWMKRNDRTTIDIAYFAKISNQTVRNFLAGKNVNRSTRMAILTAVCAIDKETRECGAM